MTNLADPTDPTNPTDLSAEAPQLDRVLTVEEYAAEYVGHLVAAAEAADIADRIRLRAADVHGVDILTRARADGQ